MSEKSAEKNSSHMIEGAEELFQEALESIERIESESQEFSGALADIGDLDAAFAAAAPGETSLQDESHEEIGAAFSPGVEQEHSEEVAEQASEALEQTTEALEEKSEQLLKAEAKIDLLESKLQSLQEALETSEKSLEEAEQEKQQHYNRLLRTSADFDNLRKRSAKEKSELKKYGAESAMRDLLDVLDNFDRALESIADASDSVKEGLGMVHRQLQDAMKKNGVAKFSSKGEPFDPNLHEALSLMQTDEMPANSVYEEFQPGYMFHERLLRAARVVVSKAPPPPPEPEPEVEEEAAEQTLSDEAAKVEAPDAEVQDDASMGESASSEEFASASEDSEASDSVEEESSSLEE